MSRMVNHTTALTVGTIAFDAVTNANSTSTTLSWTHTAGATTTIVVVGLNVGSLSTNQVTNMNAISFTYGGIVMNEASGMGSDSSRTNTAGGQKMFYLLNPPTGAQTVTMVGASSPGSFGGYTAAACSYSGVESVGTYLGQGSSSNGTTAPTPALECFSGAWCVSLHTNNASSGSFSSPTGTSRYSRSAGSSNAMYLIQDKLCTTTTQTMTATAGSAIWQADGIIMYPTNCGYVGEVLGPGTTTINCGTAAGSSTTLGVTVTSSAALRATGPFCAAVVTVTMSLTATAGTVSCGVTYGGTAMTQVDLQMGSATSGNEAVGIYILFNPPTGAQSVVVTSGGTTTKTEIIAFVQAYWNVGSAGATVNNTATSTAPTTGTVTATAITSRIHGIMVVDAAAFTAWTKCRHGNILGASVTGTGDFAMLQSTMGVVAGTTIAGTSTSVRWRAMGVELVAA